MERQVTDLDSKLRALHDTVCRGGFDDGGVTNCGSLCHVYDDLRAAADLALEAAAEAVDQLHNHNTPAGRRAGYRAAVDAIRALVRTPGGEP